MKYVRISFLFLIALTCACSQTTNNPPGEQQPAASEARDGIFIHISAGPDDPHRVLMALNMAVMMAGDKDVLVYFDIKAVEVVLKESPDISYETFPSSQGQLKKLMDMDVPLQVCPGCLRAAGHTEDDVMEGVSIADKETFFNFTDGRILSIDY